MIDKLKKMLLQMIVTNMKGYILLICIFLSGVVLSAVLNISSGSEEEIKLYINDFVSNVKNYSTDSVQTFKIAMSGYIRFAVVMFLCSVTVIGSIGALLYVFVSGFSYGAVFVSLVNMIGAKAILIFLCTVFPHVLISASCCMCYSLYCVKKSVAITKGIKDLKQSLLFPLLYGFFTILLLSVAALVQAYFEPIFIRFLNFS